MAVDTMNVVEEEDTIIATNYCIDAIKNTVSAY